MFDIGVKKLLLNNMSKNDILTEYLFTKTFGYDIII